MSIPASWVDRIFSELELAYGHRFLSQWPGIKADVVKQDWARKLAGFAGHGEAIKYALAHLPSDEPINALQFRDLCRAAPSPDRFKLPAPEHEPNPERVAEILTRLQDRDPVDRLNPMRLLLKWDTENNGRMPNGNAITFAQRQTYRQALGLPTSRARV